MTARTHQQSKGFTLLETMVAITIFLVAIIGPISIIGGSLQYIYFARDQMTAINLAQEAIEVVRQRRDTNFLSDIQWDASFIGDCPPPLGCVVDTNPNPNIYKCTNPTNTCPDEQQKVYKDPNDGFYHQYASAPPPVGVISTPYKRWVSIDKVNNNNDNEYKVQVTVTWKTGNTPGSVTVAESVFRWAKP